MSLNWKEIDLVLSEIDIVGGKIQQAFQITPQLLFFEIYTPHKKITIEHSLPSIQFLAISLEPKNSRIHLLSQRLKKPKKAQRFQQLLQARIIGCTISDIEHVNHDRIIKITLERKNQEQDINKDFFLYIQLWGNHNNIILTDKESKIIDLAMRRPQQSLMPGNIFSIEKRNTPASEVEIRYWDKTIYPQFNLLIEQEYSQKNKSNNKEQTLSKYQNAFQKQQKQLSQNQKGIEKQITEKSDYKKLEKYGNYILNNIAEIREDQKSLDITLQVENTETTYIISLDPKLTASQNAQKYFTLAKKNKRSLDMLYTQLKTVQDTLRELEEIGELLHDENSYLSEEQINILFPKSKQKNNTQSTKKQSSPMDAVKVLLQDSTHIIMIGRNAKENDNLLRRVVKGNDMWLHVRGHSGAYVFIRSQKNKTISLETLILGGQLAALFSKAKNEAYSDIYYTQAKYLKRIKGKPGLVSPLRDKNLQIKVDLAMAKAYLNKHSVER